MKTRPTTFLLAILTVLTPTIALMPSQPAIAEYGGMVEPLTFREEILKLVNIERKKVDAPPLVLNRPLNNAAQHHSDEMALRGQLTHLLPSGGPLERRVKLVGYTNYSAIGQNIAVSSSSPADTVSRWMTNSKSRNNMLNPAFKELGVGLRKADALTQNCKKGNSKYDCTFMSNYMGDEGFSQYYWTQVFGAAR
jgi:uncharacterized protein YkwD